jgi:hypothetical protein
VIVGRVPTVDPDVLRRLIKAMEEGPRPSVEEVAAAIDRAECARLRRERGL